MGGQFAKQVSVFLENKAGRLAEVCSILGSNNINIRALSIADTSDFGILRMIVSDPVRASQALTQAGFVVRQADVLAVLVDDRPGGLAEVLDKLAAAEINVEYLYAFITPLEGQAVVIFRVADALMDKAAEVLRAAGVELIEPEKLYSM